MQCNFQVGQKVVCVDNTPLKPPVGYRLISSVESPVKGKVYTVRVVMPGIMTGRPCIQVEEIPDQGADVIGPDGIEYVVDIIWEAAGFRPVVEPSTETGMSILRELLNTQDKPAEVVA